ncbi:Mbov_0392 family ICE element protein [Mycoplasma seminis]|uniref:Uncharacterized protein n=1 Tax=Mycoplasma seminis TaxID=512749 RepID=A0ABY9H9F9_9MOLU|nr:hypothetical protein [Mycoplasma seminis]WLP85220.1 hypothetical protein Q8852_02770 [Mycoplasma seminis]
MFATDLEYAKYLEYLKNSSYSEETKEYIKNTMNALDSSEFVSLDNETTLSAKVLNALAQEVSEEDIKHMMQDIEYLADGDLDYFNLSNEYSDWKSDNEYTTEDELRETVDANLKENGIDARYLNLAYQLNHKNIYGDYIKVDEYENDFEEYDEDDLKRDFINAKFSDVLDEMFIATNGEDNSDAYTL